jgi:hypothetical protein
MHVCGGGVLTADALDYFKMAAGEIAVMKSLRTGSDSLPQLSIRLSWPAPVFC